MDKEYLIEMLETNLICFEPEIYLSKYVKSIRDVYEYRSFLKELPYSEYTLMYLTNIVAEAVKEDVRFKTLDCLKVIKTIVKDKPDEIEMERETVKNLFFLYKKYIFHQNEEIQWCVSVFIKAQRLDDDSISWLISNYQKSEQIVNRILRYPYKNSLIKEWAVNVYKNDEFSERKSEIIAILIDRDIPVFIEEINNDLIVWAIYYSKASNETKMNLLKENYSVNCIHSTLKVCKRLNYPSVINFLLKKVKCIGNQVLLLQPIIVLKSS